jgi:hypothetical protein
MILTANHIRQFYKENSITVTRTQGEKVPVLIKWDIQTTRFRDFETSSNLLGCPNLEELKPY